MTEECRQKKVCPFLLLENSRPLSPWGPPGLLINLPRNWLSHKEIQPVNPKGNQSRIFTGRTDAEAETSILWPPDGKSQLIWEDPDAGKDQRQEEKGTTEGEMVGWHHWLNGHEFEQIPVDGEGQESLACCSLWGLKELDTTEQLKDWTTITRKGRE